MLERGRETKGLYLPPNPKQIMWKKGFSTQVYNNKTQLVPIRDSEFLKIKMGYGT
jgi:hypothetical protein